MLYCKYFLGEVEAPAVSGWIAQLLEKLRFVYSVWCPAQMFRFPEENLRCKSQGERFSWCCVSKNPVALKLATCPGLCMGISSDVSKSPARTLLLTVSLCGWTLRLVEVKCISFLGPLWQTPQTVAQTAVCCFRFCGGKGLRCGVRTVVFSRGLSLPCWCHLLAMSSCGPSSVCPHPCLSLYEDTSLMGSGPHPYDFCYLRHLLKGPNSECHIRG